MSGDPELTKEIYEVEKLFDAPSAAANLSSSHDPVEQCLSVGLDTLEGARGLARDSLSLAAANVLFAHGRATSLAEAVENVYLCLDNGSALASFQSMTKCPFNAQSRNPPNPV